MTFFEQELKRLFGKGELFQNPRIVGNTCYGRLTDQIRVKIQFKTGMISNQYDRLKVTLLNRNEGVIDSMVLKFQDVWGMKRTTNPNFREGVSPHIWADGRDADWYVYHPENADYRKLSEAVTAYLDVFREPQEEMRMGQKLC